MKKEWDKKNVSLNHHSSKAPPPQVPDLHSKTKNQKRTMSAVHARTCTESRRPTCSSHAQAALCLFMKIFSTIAWKKKENEVFCTRGIFLAC
jgi:hypothetical protein